MQQIFQCQRCGAQNYAGQAFCWNCNERFQYYCPWCNAPVDPTLPICHNCRALLPWQAQQSAGYQQIREGDRYAGDEAVPSKRNPLIIALACLALVAVIALAVIYLPGMVKQSGQSQPPASQSQPSQPHPATAPTDNEF